MTVKYERGLVKVMVNNRVKYLGQRSFHLKVAHTDTHGRPTALIGH